MRPGAPGVEQAALHAAGRGWPVFPLRPGGKVPLIRAAHRAGDPCRGECGQLGHGFHDATTDPAVIEAWWRAWPGANYGISTGPAGLVVIDLDVGKGVPPRRVLPDQGEQEATPTGIRNGADVLAWAAHRDLAGPPGGDLADGELADDAGECGWVDTLSVRTPSGGTHLYYAAPVGLEVRSSVGHTGVGAGARITGLGWSVDVRAGGGYVVGPGSLAPGRLTGDMVAAGGNSSAVGYAAIIKGAAAPIPAWLTNRLAALGSLGDRTPCMAGSVTAPASSRPGSGYGAGYGSAALVGELANIAASQPSGTGGAGGSGRNATLNRAAFKLGRILDACGLDPDHVGAELLAAGQAVGLSPREAATAIASGLAQGRANPRANPRTDRRADPRAAPHPRPAGADTSRPPREISGGKP